MHHGQAGKSRAPISTWVEVRCSVRNASRRGVIELRHGARGAGNLGEEECVAQLGMRSRAVRGGCDLRRTTQWDRGCDALVSHAKVVSGGWY